MKGKNQLVIDMMMDTILDEDNDDQLEEMSHEDAQFINNTVLPFYETNKNK